jgi:hypothetical protein
MSVLRSTRYNPGSVYNAPPPGATADAWDPRPSMDEGGGYDGKGYGHQRDFSDASARYEDAYAEGSHAYPNEDEYGRGEEGYGYAGAPGQYPFSTPGGGYVDHPAEARSRDPGQTPTVNNYEAGQGVGWRGGDGGLRRPEEVRNHPGW